jgi:mannose-1-phosphate guanylyltransferase|tara:strand:+ start:261 stop:1526 length:1266 start_codon:yes stop_codon:yes gene_type:complete
MAPKAIILVGGLGTQLRPLTLSKPKALIDFGNKPLLQHLIDGLARAGVSEIILAINYRAEIMREFLDKIQRQYSITITCSQESEPLGTAGPLAMARGLLQGGDDPEPFFVMNCDIVCDCNFGALLAFHRAHGKLGTIIGTRVGEPAKYGKSVIVAHETGLVDKFVEHGRTFAGNLINAGVYVFSPGLLERIALRPTSMEREVLPELAAEDQLYCHELKGGILSLHPDTHFSHMLHTPFPHISECNSSLGYWMNVKQPRDFLQGHALFLKELARTPSHGEEVSHLGRLCHADNEGAPPVVPPPEEVPGGSTFIGNVQVDPSATIGAGCCIGPDVTIGAGCVLEGGARLMRCILLEGVTVSAHSTVIDSICGWRSTVGRWTRVEGVSVLGEDVHLGNEIHVNGALILPHKHIHESVIEPRIIM